MIRNNHNKNGQKTKAGTINEVIFFDMTISKASPELSCRIILNILNCHKKASDHLSGCLFLKHFIINHGAYKSTQYFSPASFVYVLSFLISSMNFRASIVPISPIALTAMYLSLKLPIAPLYRCLRKSS